MKRQTMVILVMALLVFTAAAHTEEALEEAEQLIQTGIPCDELSEDQLDHIGDYYMEQLHPGVMHEVMDARMGGEGSESLRQAHIAMAYRFYCDNLDGQGTVDSSGWGMRGFGMMGPGMMSGWGSGMGYGYGHGWLAATLWILLIAAVIAAVVMLLRQRKESALDTLKERYARGELSKKEFEEMKRDLTRR